MHSNQLWATTLAATALSLGLGCSAQVGDEPPLDRTGFDLDVCAGAPSLLDAITPTLEVDYLELSGGWSVMRRGTRCGGASDLAACEAAFERLLPATGWPVGPGGGAPAPTAYLSYTRGDEVGTVGQGEVGAFLAPADSVHDAAFLAQVATAGSVDCTAPAARAVSGGIEILTTTQYPCGGAVEESRVLIAPDGSATVLETALIQRGVETICP